MKASPALPLALLLAACAQPSPAPPALGPPPDPPGPFEKTLLPFLKKRCVVCHDRQSREGGLALDAFTSAASVRKAPKVWRAVQRMLRSGKMPPDDEPQPKAAEVAAVVSAVDAVLGRPAHPRARPNLRDPGRPTLRRLNRVEYNNTVRDLLGVTFRPADAFPDDDVGYGFDTIGDVLSMSPLLLEKYLLAAEAISEQAVQVFKPLKRRFQAEKASRRGRGHASRGWAKLATNGEFRARTRVRFSGEYWLRARAYGDQAGREPARMAFRIDGRRRGRVWVRAVRAKPQVYRVKVRIPAGEHTVAVAFTNDYWNPKHPDRTKRDRNLAVDWFELEGPLARPPLPAYHQRTLGKRMRKGQDPLDFARTVLQDLASRAFRRPATGAEVARLVSLVKATLANKESFERGVQVAIQAILVSPHFLFRVELDPRPHDPKAVHAITEFELAARLSYFLWSTLPDARLFQQARAGTLRLNLDAEVRRMLDSPKASALATNFAGQWLQLRRLTEVSPDPRTFPSFDERLREAMRAESELLFEAVLRENRSVLDFIDGRFTFVNERLARHYGIPGVRGTRFRRVTLPRERGGVLTHASVLTITSQATRTSPVLRGKWILETFLNDPPAPPPPGTDSLADAVKDRKGLTLRQQMALHRKKAACASCHVKLDPLGFGLERFDAIGAYRRDGRGIDDSGVLPGGVRFRGAVGLRRYLKKNAAKFVIGLAEKLLIYGLGRGPLPSDAAALEKLVTKLGPRYRFHDLILGLVRLDAFQKRRGEPSRKEAKRD